VLPEAKKGFMCYLLGDISIEDHEVDRAHDERKQAYVESLEGSAVSAVFSHDIS
jgi:hypothetical protein